jgi:hypothetical protein
MGGSGTERYGTKWQIITPCLTGRALARIDRARDAKETRDRIHVYQVSSVRSSGARPQRITDGNAVYHY